VVANDLEESTEAGHIGRDGMVGAVVASGMKTAPNQTLMQIAGHGWRMSADDFRECMAECAALRTAALLFDQSLHIQVCHTLLATARYTIHERLARWLLMCHDRVDGDHFELTHDFLALMLTVRRSGVTTELHILEGMRLIRSTRGNIHILNRAGLIKVASGSYGVPEREYGKLFPMLYDGETNVPTPDRHAG
jgi:hypothetical protein